MKKFFLGLGAIIILLVAVVLVRTMQFKPEPRVVTAGSVTVQIDAALAAQHLSQAVTFKTVSPQPPQARDDAEFTAFTNWVISTYPEVNEKLFLKRIAEHTLLYRWQGTDHSQKPILLTGHFDVVPVIPGTEDIWLHPPFSGDIEDGVIWGRGALDDKSAVIAQLEAVTALVKEGFTPSRTVYLSFGHDEEIGGRDGAQGVAEYLGSRGIQLAWSLDEGSFLLDGLLPGVDKPFASINVAEKGYVSIDLVAKAAGGHSSMPPNETAVGILSAAILKLQENQVPAALDGPGMATFDAAARHMSFTRRMLFANKWLFGGPIISILEQSAATNAMIRTTTAPTMLSGSIKENVLPIEAIGTVNFRIHPRDTVESVAAHVEKTIDDSRIELRVRPNGGNASPVSSNTSEGFNSIADSADKVFGDIIVGAGMTVAGTDSKRYGKVADDAYRFNPMVVTPMDITGFHGTNESLSVENLQLAAIFYAELIKDSAGQKQE